MASRQGAARLLLFDAVCGDPLVAAPSPSTARTTTSSQEASRLWRGLFTAFRAVDFRDVRHAGANVPDAGTRHIAPVDLDSVLFPFDRALDLLGAPALVMHGHGVPASAVFLPGRAPMNGPGGEVAHDVTGREGSIFRPVPATQPSIRCGRYWILFSLRLTMRTRPSRSAAEKLTMARLSSDQMPSL